MHFADEYEIGRWLQIWASHPILASAAATLCSLKDAVNGCSDGWAYWQAPGRAAQKLVALLADADSTYRRGETPQLTAADLDRAYRPIKAFHTRYATRYGFEVQFSYPVVEPVGNPALTLFA